MDKEINEKLKKVSEKRKKLIESLKNGFLATLVVIVMHVIQLFMMAIGYIGNLFSHSESGSCGVLVLGNMVNYLSLAMFWAGFKYQRKDYLTWYINITLVWSILVATLLAYVAVRIPESGDGSMNISRTLTFVILFEIIIVAMNFGIFVHVMRIMKELSRYKRYFNVTVTVTKTLETTKEGLPTELNENTL